MQIWKNYVIITIIIICLSRKFLEKIETIVFALVDTIFLYVHICPVS